MVAAASENISPPVAVTMAGGWLVVTLNGPSTLWAGPLTGDGVIVRLGFGCSPTGTSCRMWSTMPATSACSGSDASSTYLSVKYQMAPCTAAAVWL